MRANHKGRYLPVRCSNCSFSCAGDLDDNLLAVCPDIVKWWNYEKNAPFKPQQFTKGSQFRAYLLCPDCGLELYTGSHSLVKTLDNGKVVIRHAGLCRKFKAQVSDNNLVKQYPEVIRWWDKVKNFPNNPEDFTVNSRHKTYFKCPDCGLITQKRISDAFILNANGIPAVFDCRYCNDRTVPGVNSLKALYPEIAAECVSKVDTDRVNPNVFNSYDWQCSDCKGVYPAVVALRVKGNGCPYCDGRKALPGYNSFKFVHPDIMKEWLELENLLAGVDADKHLPTSNQQAWWQCPICNYKYTMSFADRSMKKKRGHNPCPKCNGRRQPRLHYM